MTKNISFYLDNSEILGTDFSKPENGNPGCGGTQYATVSLAYELSKAGCSVTIYCTREIILPRIVAHETVTNLHEAGIRSKVNNQIFIVNSPHQLDTTFLKTASLENIFLVLWMHNDPSQSMLRQLSNLKSIKAFVTIGERQFYRYINSPIRKRLKLIVNGQYIRTYPIKKTKPKNITYIGALVHQKGFHILADAWTKISESHPDAKLNVIGSGNLHNFSVNSEFDGLENNLYLRDIRSKLGEHNPSINFYGRISALRKDEIISETLLGVFNPSGNTENCPASGLDFSAAGIPVISAKVRGSIDVIRDGYSGWLIPPRSEKLAKKIIFLLDSDPELISSLSNQCIDFVAKKFNFKDVTDEWFRLFENIYSQNNFERQKLPKAKSMKEIFRKCCSHAQRVINFDLSI